MKRKFSVFTILLLIFPILGCKNHALIDDALLHKNNDEHVITLQLNESSNARAITIPEIYSLEVNYYKIIITRDGNAKTYDFEKSDTYNISVKNGINTFEIAGYNTRTQTESGYQYSKPVLYSNNSITIDSETDSISLTVSPIIKTYTQGELAGVADEGTVSFTVKMPSQAENSEKLKLISINGLPKTIAYTFKDEDKSSPIVHTTDTKAAPGVYNCSIIVQTTDNQNFLYSQSVYCAMNLITPVFLDFSNESFSSDGCGELGYINFYDSNNSGTNLISFDEDTQNYTCYGIDRTNTYYLELTMKVAGQKIDVSIKKDGDTDFGSPLVINNLPGGYEITFVDENPTVNNNYIQKLKYPFDTNQLFWMDATGGSEVKISVSKGGASKDYIIKLSPEVPVVSEDTEVSHPVDVSAMTALPVPVTELTETTYVITNEAQLFALGTYVNGGEETTGMTFVLGKDIKLTQDWVPIGTEELPFKGIFEGNNYKVSGINIPSADSKSGFFGVIESSSVNNLTVEGTIECGNYKNYIGGICGSNKGNSYITNCINNVKLSCNAYVGGIIGYINTGTLFVSNCLNFAEIQGSDSRVAGIVGYVSGLAEAHIENCGNYGSINGYSLVSGIANNIATVIVENCVNNGTVTSSLPSYTSICYSEYNYVSTSISNSAYLSGSAGTKTSIGSDPNPDTVSSYSHTTGQMGCTLTTAIGSTTDVKEMLNSASEIGTSYNRWIYTTNETYYGLPMFADTMARLNEVVTPGGSGHKPIDATWKNITEYFSGDTVSVLPQSGETVVISDVAELSKVNKLLASSNLEGVTIILNDNINFTDNKPSGFNNIYGSQKFSGTFDGNNYRIYNYSFKVNSTYVGFIASLENGTICNLIIEGTSVECGNGCGAIAGQTSGTMTKIDNCIVKINVENASSSFYGGLVGYVGSGTTTIRNCINFGNVSAKERAGGLIGQIGNSATAVIENCANYGQITAVNDPSYSGGLVGYLGGTVSIVNSFNYGECASGDPVCGYKAGSGSVSYINNCFYNSVYSSTSILENTNKFSPTGANIEETKFIYNTSDLKTLLSDWAQDNTVVNQTYNKWDYKTMNLNGVDTRVLVFE